MSKDHTSVSVFGGSGFGKSFFVLYLIEQTYLEKPFTIVWDSKGEYLGLTQFGFKQAIFTENLLSTLTPKKAVEIIKANPRLLLKGLFLTIEEQQALVNIFAQATLYIGNTTFIIDEASTILENRPNTDYKYLTMLSSEGRGVGVNTIFVYQRLAQINKMTLSQSNVYFSFNIHEANDLIRAAAVMNTNKEELMILKPREYIYYNVRTGKQEKLSTQGLKLKTKHFG